MNEHAVKARAYLIWEREGKPQGQAERHWQMAEFELEQGIAESKPQSSWHEHFWSMIEHSHSGGA